MVIVMMGVSGTGKTTVGQALADAVDGRFHDADEFHPAANIEKMKSGRPLTDHDREPWLDAMRDGIEAWLTQPGVDVLACSVLKERYRRRLGVDGISVRLVHLRGNAELIRARMQGRDHFMADAMLDSQFEALEPPTQALTLDIEEPVDRLVDRIRATWDL